MEKITLKNGLRIMLQPDEHVRTACFGVWVAAGSCYESPSESGVSHFIEHMVFKGTGRRSARDIAEDMDMLGGQLYAYTGKECTSYYVRTLSQHVAQGFEILCDMLTNPRFSPQDIDTERGVILEEINMSEDEPEDLLMEQLYSACWKDCPYGGEILGSRKTVGTVTDSVLRDFMKKNYTASRIVVAIGGCYDREEFLDLCEKYFGSLPLADAFRPELSMSYSPSHVLTRRPLEQTHICLCLPGISSENDDRYAMGMLSSILGGASSSRLFQRIREELGLVYSIYSDAIFYTGGGVLCICLAANPDSAPLAVEETLRILRDMGNDVTSSEFERTRESLKTSTIMSLESISSRVVNMGTKELLQGRVKSADELLESIGRVTLDDVRRIAHSFLRSAPISSSIVGPISSRLEELISNMND